MKGNIFVISAPSGAGKTTLLKRLLARKPDLIFSVSLTTRKPRENEVDGVDYAFCDTEEFEALVKRDDLAEWQEVHGNFYGTPKKNIEDALSSGSDIVLDIDVYGKSKFDCVYPQNVGILIRPPDMNELEKRIRQRKSDSEDAIKTRMRNAVMELQFADEKGQYEHILTNDELESTLRKLVSIIEQHSSDG